MLCRYGAGLPTFGGPCNLIVGKGTALHRVATDGFLEEVLCVLGVLIGLERISSQVELVQQFQLLDSQTIGQAEFVITLCPIAIPHALNKGSDEWL